MGKFAPLEEAISAAKKKLDALGVRVELDQVLERYHGRLTDGLVLR